VPGYVAGPKLLEGGCTGAPVRGAGAAFLKSLTPAIQFLSAVTLLLVLPDRVGAQSTLEEAVAEAREAWKTHRVAVLVSKSDTVRLHLPGIAMSAALKPGQASRLLGEYLEDAEELEFELRDVRQLADDHAYAEMSRVFVVKGTTEKRIETVFLGFRILAGEWRLREVRITP